MQERAVGDEARAVGVGGASVCERDGPRCVRSSEQLRDLAERGPKIRREAHRAHLAVGALRPLVAEHEPGSGFVDVERSVEALPVSWSHRAVAPGCIRTLGSCGPQHLRAPVAVRSRERREHEPRPVVSVHLGRPVAARGPESRWGAERREGTRPLGEIEAPVAVEPDARALPDVRIGAPEQVVRRAPRAPAARTDRGSGCRSAVTLTSGASRCYLIDHTFPNIRQSDAETLGRKPR